MMEGLIAVEGSFACRAAGKVEAPMAMRWRGDAVTSAAALRPASHGAHPIAPDGRAPSWRRFPGSRWAMVGISSRWYSDTPRRNPTYGIKEPEVVGELGHVAIILHGGGELTPLDVPADVLTKLQVRSTIQSMTARLVFDLARRSRSFTLEGALHPLAVPCYDTADRCSSKTECRGDPCAEEGHPAGRRARSRGDFLVKAAS